MILNIYTDRLVGYARVWVRDRVQDHTLIAVPRLRLTQESAMGMMEHGESLLSTFRGSKMMLDGVEVAIAPLAGTFMLPRTGEPDLNDFVAVVPGKVGARLSTLLTRGLGMLK
jgi:hypothetical protein